MDHFDQMGNLALASRLRRLLNQFLADGQKVYRYLGIDFNISWFPVVHLLSSKSPLTLTEISSALGMSHPSVIEVTNAMINKNIIGWRRNVRDRRSRELFLTDKGKRLVTKLEPVWEAFKLAGNEIVMESGGFLESLKKMEISMERCNMYERIIRKL